ncbi:hypothetical protein N9C66_02630 [Akkermansiaceae bacterium]|nr:hypothetical protein [Akkermansiaceae bacterium]MDA9830212.1 hypothetical protein [Akkermansiaceae bacterium]
MNKLLAMTPAQKNFAASTILLIVFGATSSHLSRENRRLESIIPSFHQQQSEGSKTNSARTARSRERTVADLVRKYSAPITARELLQKWSLTENSQSLENWKTFQFYLARLSTPELLELDRELRTIDGPDHIRDRLLQSLQSLLHEKLKENQSQFFDHVIAHRSVDQTTQHYFAEWAKSNPQAALAWFRTKDPELDFENGTFQGIKNRSLLLTNLLAGLAVSEISTAIAVLREENKRGRSFPVPPELSEELIDRAVRNGDDSNLYHLLMSNRLNHQPNTEDPFIKGSWWKRFTSQTKDPDRSVKLLHSLEKPHGYGTAMAAIISSQEDLSLEKQIDWLREKIPERPPLDRAISQLLLGESPDNPFGENTFSQEAREWLDQQSTGPDKDAPFTDLATGLRNSGNYLGAFQVAQKLTHSPENKALVLKVAQLLQFSDPQEAARALPTALLEQVTADQE